MITVKLMGGLGNQMFQRAYGLALQNRGYLVEFNREAEVPSTHREYSLGEYDKTLRFNQREQPAIFEQGLRFQADKLNPPDGSILVGYWQSEKYFSDVRNQVRGIFSPVRTRATTTNIGLHVRRADYVGLEAFHGLPTAQYYREAVQRIWDTKGFANVLVFSDDLQWCRDTLPSSFTFVAGQTKYQDLASMASCAHMVIANSSFSWWGAWLGGDDPERMIVAPKHWFSDQSMADDADMVPERWIRL